MKLIDHIIFCCVRTRVRPIHVCVSSYRGLFLYVSQRIRNNPPVFFQNTYTGSVRIILENISESPRKMFFTVPADTSRHHVTVYYRKSHICSSGFFAYAIPLFYRFRTVFRVRYGILPYCKSRVRPISPSDFMLRARSLAYDPCPRE